MALDPLLAAKGELMIIAGPDYDSDKILKTPEAREVITNDPEVLYEGHAWVPDCAD
ncbi:MAG: hypothetical protein Ct9H300mP21_05250 [Pseudomonadota bacterium]|nr:MAG: hypothetical protein Ct9H300mP21_05250 [Pseudomonadota bacterium]